MEAAAPAAANGHFHDGRTGADVAAGRYSAGTSPAMTVKKATRRPPHRRRRTAASMTIQTGTDVATSRYFASTSPTMTVKKST